MSETEATDSGPMLSQATATGSPTVAVARERLVEAIGREAAFLADQRAGQASAGLEVLARAFTLVAPSPSLVSPGGLNPSAGDTSAPQSRMIINHNMNAINTNRVY
ncbi:hypothetical protein OHS33_04805 [Streptomyces sp. NBC_00536]|uniref:hypothetical protein n=1 Tax=Streptomyces sp. NBC_00536 TaxID=2975769 RepID=UPI002E816BEE|nr:hypothetical protein [Streptomyces sp. NBC_00536]WUC77717.1 hypothetical protein OHS33_04805 [Streptomyces sp. NBC_00536]